MEGQTTQSGKEKRLAYKAKAKEMAKAYLAEKKALKTGEEKKKFKADCKAKVNDWRESLKSMDKAEKKAQKRAYKVFKKRKNLTVRAIAWGLALCLVVSVGVSIAPTVSMLTEVLGTQKYTSDGPEADAARAAGYALATAINEEGFVLLKNEDALLPMAKETGISIFGDDAYNFVYGGSGSAGASQADAVSIFDAFEQAGINYNKELDATYRELGVSEGGGSGSIMEMLIAHMLGKTESTDWLPLQDDVIEKARNYSGTALIVLSSMEVEGAEIELKKLQIMGSENPVRAQLIDRVCKTFEHVIFIINSGNVMELDFLNKYPSADAALWVGSPGSLGCHVIADVLTGKVNPSGRTVDTWPVAIANEPSYATYGSNKLTNLDMYTMPYTEGIYVGYRYYETRYGNDSKAYSENVVFPFGYGLSYTEFTEELESISYEKDTVTAAVKVTNIGKTAGKDVVEMYFMSPYNQNGGIEKSAIELAGYAKTGLLEPNASETVRISWDIRDMASYSEKIGGYILERGDYKIAVGKNVHEALLSEEYQLYHVAADVNYTTDEKTGADIENRFEAANGNLTYLSRADWDGTFPKAQESYTASDALIAAKAEYEKGLTVYGQVYDAAPTMGASNGITLDKLKGLDYNDPLWQQFLDQFTAKEMIGLTANGGWHTREIARLGVKGSRLLDGPSGINSMFSSLTAVAYPMETVIGSSWNNDLALKLGETIGDEAAIYGVNGWYAPGMNIHRTSIGGRNNEYFSEDPLLSGKMSAAAITGAQSKGLIAFMKHFVCNDVEINARSGIIIYANEQSLREIYLRPFELAVKDGGAYGAMSSFSFLGDKWCGGSSELLVDVLRDEWGFAGMVTTDATLGAWMNAGLAIKNGNDLMLEMGIQASEKKLKDAYKADPAGIGHGLRNSTHNICYALVNGTNGY